MNPTRSIKKKRNINLKLESSPALDSRVESNTNLDSFNSVTAKKSSEKKISLNKKKWKDIHPDFTPELQKEWEEKGFNYEGVKEWVNISLKVNDADFANWLSTEQEYTVEEVLSNCDIKKLREEWKIYLEKNHRNK